MDCFHFYRHIRQIVLFSCFFLIWVFLNQPSVVCAEDWKYTVKPGDNLWNLSERYLSSMRYLPQLQSLNNVVDPRDLPPGSILKIPLPWLKVLPTTAQIISLNGKVIVTDETITKNLIAALGTTVESGDQLMTSSNASVTLEFKDKSRVQLQQESYLIFKNLKTLGETGIAEILLHLREGNMTIKVKPQRNRNSRFEISTPSAIAAVRGTQYRISADAVGSESRAEVLEGKVAVTNVGQTVITPEGFGALVKKGQPPSTPVKLLPALDLSAFPTIIRRLPLEFTFNPLVGAVAYHREILVDNGNDTLQSWDDLPLPKLTVDNLDDGDYIVHVRGIDRNGFGGRNGIKRFSVNTFPLIPKPMATNADRSFNTPHSTFRWSKVKNASSYKFQLSTEPDFRAPLIEARIQDKTAFVTDQTLNPDRYYWRIAAVNDQNRSGPYSEPQSIEIKEVNRYWVLALVIPLLLLLTLILANKKRE